MKIEKITIDGKKSSIEVADKILSAKINKKLVSNVLYKVNANFKGRKAKTKQKNEKALQQNTRKGSEAPWGSGTHS